MLNPLYRWERQFDNWLESKSDNTQTLIVLLPLMMPALVLLVLAFVLGGE